MLGFAALVVVKNVTGDMVSKLDGIVNKEASSGKIVNMLSLDVSCAACIQSSQLYRASLSNNT